MNSRTAQAIEQIRRFDRFYEKRLRKAVGAIATEDFVAVDLRVLNELGWSDRGLSGSWLAFRLDLDTGYLCRVLKKLEAYRLVASNESLADGRIREWELTRVGRRLADDIESEYRDRAARLLNDVFPPDQARLVEAMRIIEEILRPTLLRDLFDVRSFTPSASRIS